MPYVWQLVINPKLKTQNSIISFGYVDFYAKIFLILYPCSWNSITGNVISYIKSSLTSPTLTEVNGRGQVSTNSSSLSHRKLLGLLSLRWSIFVQKDDCWLLNHVNLKLRRECTPLFRALRRKVNPQRPKGVVDWFWIDLPRVEEL